MAKVRIYGVKFSSHKKAAEALGVNILTAYAASKRKNTTTVEEICRLAGEDRIKDFLRDYLFFKENPLTDNLSRQKKAAMKKADKASIKKVTKEKKKKPVK